MISKKGDDDDTVDTDIDLETNVTNNTELSTSVSVARKLTENPDENVDIADDFFNYLTFPAKCSAYDILKE